MNNIALLDITKSVNKSTVAVGDIVTFKLVALNNGNIIIGNVTNKPVYIYDTLPPELEFIKSSVKINNVSNPDLNINSGVNLGILNMGESKTITFDAKVISHNLNSITNAANGSFGYVTATGSPTQGASTSNIITLDIFFANIDLSKTSNKDFVVLGEKVTYTVNLVNDGNTNVKNVIFKDTLPKDTKLVEGSFSINGTTINKVDLSKGVNIGNILAGQTSIVKYTVEVISPNCKLQIINEASATFDYILPDGSTGKGKTEITENSSNLINLGITNFKQLSIEEYLKIPNIKPNLDKINKITGDIDIILCHVIETSKLQSTEGQTLSGYKLIIHGVLRHIVEYTACEETQRVHSAHYDIPFSTFIILPNNYVYGSKVDIDTLVENIYYKEVDCRTFFTNATILINAKILSC